MGGWQASKFGPGSPNAGVEARRRGSKPVLGGEPGLEAPFLGGGGQGTEQGGLRSASCNSSLVLHVRLKGLWEVQRDVQLDWMWESSCVRMTWQTGVNAKQGLKHNGIQIISYGRLCHSQFIGLVWSSVWRAVQGVVDV